jgi:type I restriction enzyme S subunit
MSSKKKITVTKGDDKPVLVPKLRFSGFDKPWSNDPLSKTLKEHKIKNTDGREVFSVSMEYGIVNQIELLGRSYAAADTSNYTVGRRFDVVYTKSPLKAFPFGIVKQCKFDGEVALSPLYGVFTPPNPYVGLMIEAYFEAPNRSKDFLAPLCQKGAKNTLQITNATFLSGSLPLPTQPTEQKKIAECLSSVDELIAAQTLKLNALKIHKIGLMQQIFPREGETQPRLRFPEFQNAGEWELTTVGGLVETNCLFPPKDGNHGNIHPKSADYVAQGIPFVMASDLKGGLIDIETCHFISKEQADKLQKGFAKEGDVLLSHKGTVGEVAVVREIHTPYLMLTPQVTYYRVKDRKKLSNEFLAQLFVSETFQSNLLEVSGGGTRAYIGITEQAKLRVQLPIELAEQQRIADCLTSLDDLIAAQSQKLEALKTHKKGLMQQLFPSTEEVDA